MNYYNPYFYTMPNSFNAPKIGILSRLFGNNNITLSGILNGTQKVLNFANQTIPLVRQVKPMIGNAKTMFKVMNEFKKIEKPKYKNNDVINKTSNNNIIEKKNYNTNKINYKNGPTFFM